MSKVFKNTKTKFFIISFTSDWLYPTVENREIVIALNAINADVGFLEIKSDYNEEERKNFFSHTASIRQIGSEIHKK